MKIKLEKGYYYIVYFLTIIGIFFLNNDRLDTKNLIILNIFLSFFTLIFFFIIADIYIRKKAIKSNTDKILIAFMLFFSLITLIIRSYVSIHWIYLLTAYFIVYSPYSLSKRTMQVSCFFIFISLCIQLLFIRFEGVRPVLSYIDPNYSGFIIFSFFLFLYHNGFKKIALITSLLGLLTLSRAYLLAILLFYVINTRWLAIYFIIKKSRLYKIIPLALGIIFIPLVIGYFYLTTYTDIKTKYVYDSSRYVSLVDKSNEHRFLANKSFFNDLVKNPSKYLFGRDFKEYTKNVFMNTPHHSVYQIIFNYGILFGFFYLLIFFRLLNKFLSTSNMPYILSFSVFLLFLGGGIYGIQVIFLFFILKESKYFETKNRFFYS